MKIPKYIEYLISRRAKLAADLCHADMTLSQWLESNDIETEDYDTRGGCEMFVNPYNSADRIRQAITDKGGF